MMMLRWRASSAAAAAVVRRPLWTQPTSRALSTLADEEEEETQKRIYTAAQKKRLIAAKAKETSEKVAREFALLPPALKAFHQKTGHFIVPLNLRCVSTPAMDGTLAKGTQDRYTRIYGCVQDSSEIDWPKEALAEKLNIGQVLCKLMKNANHRQNHPEVTSELRAMGFPVEEAARTGALPRGDASWPETTWGFPLGVHVNVIRRQMNDHAPEQLEDLERLGFSFNVSQTKWTTKILPSFKVYAKLEGHCRIPSMFVVPMYAPWPKEAWGLKLGEIVSTIRCLGVYAKQVLHDGAVLESLGFQYSMPEYMWGERILPSLEVFKKVYGHCDVPRTCVVPSESPWPEEAWGDKLGYCVQNIRSHGHYADQVAKDVDRLDAIGFVWNSFDNKWANVVLPALETYHRIHGHSQIPTKFVPSEEPWAEEAWGLNLGSCVDSMKHQNSYYKQRQQDQVRLQAIGLDWLVDVAATG